jgi:hypothetical protein
MPWQDKKKDWQSVDGTVTEVEVATGRYGPIYTVSFNYKVGEHWYGGVFTGTEEYKKDDWLPVSYDPSDPDRNQYRKSEEHRRLILVSLVALLVAWALTVFVSSIRNPR